MKKKKTAVPTAVTKVIDCGSMAVTITSTERNLDFEKKAKSISDTIERCLSALETDEVDFSTQTVYSDNSINANLLALHEILMLERVGTMGYHVELITPLAGIMLINIDYVKGIWMMTTHCYDSFKDGIRLNYIGTSDRGNDYETDDGQIVHSVFWEFLGKDIEIFYEVVI